MGEEIRKLTENEFQLWNDFVQKEPAGKLFHTTGWLRLFNEKPDITAVFENGEIVGGSALARVKKYGIKGYHSLPFTPYYGILLSEAVGNNADHCQKVVTQIIEHLPASPLYDFVLTPGHQNIHAFTWKGFDTSVYVTHKIESGADPDQYIQKISPGKKRDYQTMKKLLAEGSVTIKTGPDIKNDILELVKESSNRIGYSYPEYAFNALGNFKGSHCIGVYHKEFGLLAGNILFEDDRNVYNLFNASQRIKDPRLSLANTMSMFESVAYALKQGKSFDFEGSMLKGVEKFYRSMGGEVLPVYRVIKSGSVRYNMIRFIKNRVNGRKN